MARTLAHQHHQNLWGRATDQGLEPQRHDLWRVDLSAAEAGIREAYLASGLSTPKLLPQYAKSIGLPDNKLRAETVRRSSIAYQTPSWDEPLDAVRIQFYLAHDLTETETEAPILTFLNLWLQLVRAGRGLRTTGGPDYAWREAPALTEVPGSPGSLRLPPWAFTFELLLLRGYTPLQLEFTSSDRIQLERALADQQRRDAHAADNALKVGPSTQAAPDPGVGTMSVTSQPGLLVSTRVRVRRAWLSGYKLSDFTYEGSGLSTVDATFYPESLEFGTSPQ